MSEPVPSLAPVQPVYPYRPACNPCPCTTLQCGAKIIAILELVLSSFVLILYIIALALLSEVQKILEEHPEYKLNTEIDNTVTIVVLIVLLISNIIISTCLLLGANQFNRSKCCVWIIWTLMWLLARIIMNIIDIINRYKELGSEIGILAILFLLLEISITLYLLFVVYSFTEEIKYNSSLFPVPDPQAQLGVVRPLTEDEGQDWLDKY